MSDFVWFLFSGTCFLWLVAIGVGWIALRPNARAARRFLIGVTLFYGAISIYGLGYLGERLLVRGYHPLVASDVPPGRTAVVVLGAGSFTARDWDRDTFTIVDVTAAERVLETARVARLIDPEWIVSSGGNVHPDDPYEPTGLAMRAALIQLGVPESRIVTETRSRNTYEEARIVGPMLKELGADHVVLVTSGRHMWRSVGAFRSAGVEVIPAIVRNSFVDRPWADRWLPSDEGRGEAALVTHEWLGLAGYFMTGRFQP